jgi:integrase/recombinase XerD
MQRSFLLFSSSIKSKASLDTYTRGLNGFIRFYKLKDYDSLAGMDPKMLQIMTEDFVMNKRKENLTVSGITNYIAPLEVFCDANDIDLKWKKIKRLLPAQEKRSGGKPYSTEQISLMLSYEKVIRNRAIIHFLAASGVRVGAISEIRLKHIVDFEVGCKMITVYADSKDEYVTFLTPEASQAVDHYLEKRRKDGEYLSPESPLFRITYQFGTAKVIPMKTTTIAGVLSRAVHRAGIRTVKTYKRFDIQLDHGFRKRWNTIIKNTDGMKIILAEKMMGHSVTIPLDDVYNLPEAKKLFLEYKKAISELTIDDSARTKSELNLVKSKIDETELLRKYVENLQDQIERTQDMAANEIISLRKQFEELQKTSDR